MHPIAVLAAGRLYCSFAGARASEDAFRSGCAELKKQLYQEGILCDAMLDGTAAAPLAAAGGASSR